MIDLDNNHIIGVDRKSFSVKTEQLILANNEISYIDEFAFQGSQIAMLSLKQNRLLKNIHTSAFSGVSIQKLDLSSTSLVRLPSAGLQDIEELRIENTHTLKTIPSIYYFENLQRAYLTHSFHCCAFQFPSRHDPWRHAERRKEIEEWQQHCGDTLKTKDENVVAVERIKLQRVEAEIKKFSSVENEENKEYSEKINEVYYSKGLDIPVKRDGLFIQENKRASYMSDNNMEDFGIFHDEITINPNENQMEEFCGNFTFRKYEIECFPIPNALNPCEDVMGHQWLRISVWVVLSLAVVGNVAVLTVILSVRNDMLSVPRFLMCHLAFADLCLGLYLLLIAWTDAHSMGEYFNHAYDWQYGTGCQVAGFLTVFASHLSVFTLTVITVERWFAIKHAMHLNRRIKIKAATYLMVVGWIFSLIMSALPLYGISNYSSTSICLPMEKIGIADTLYLVLMFFLNGVSFFIIAICYTQIYFSLDLETRNARSSHAGEMTVAKKMALLVFTNFACWAPIAFFGLTALAGYPLINVTQSKVLLVFFYPLNSCADPYLYAILTSQYRQDLSILLAKCGVCRQKALKYRRSLSLPITSSIRASSFHRNSSVTQKGQQTIVEAKHMLKQKEEFV